MYTTKNKHWENNKIIKFVVVTKFKDAFSQSRFFFLLKCFLSPYSCLPQCKIFTSSARNTYMYVLRHARYKDCKKKKVK